jgi:hypothetical protein
MGLDSLGIDNKVEWVLVLFPKDDVAGDFFTKELFSWIWCLMILIWNFSKSRKQNKKQCRKQNSRDPSETELFSIAFSIGFLPFLMLDCKYRTKKGSRKESSETTLEMEWVVFSLLFQMEISSLLVYRGRCKRIEVALIWFSLKRASLLSIEVVISFFPSLV